MKAVGHDDGARLLGTRYLLKNGINKIGKDPLCDVVIPYKFLSSLHASIRVVDSMTVFLVESGGDGHLENGPEMETNLSKLERCIEQLGSEQKQCVQLFYLHQKCYKEITESTGFDLNKVKSHIQNGKRNLP